MNRFVVGALALLALASCRSMGGLDDSSGVLDALGGGRGLGFAVRSVQAVKAAQTELTPQQEYYLGRAFGAQILKSRRPLGNEKLDAYVNLVGQSLALFSELPDTWLGYRFLVLDTPEVNAFAAPGGFIFVTKGLIQRTSNEAELAAVLAHEISHVALQHGVHAIQKDRLTTAFVGIGTDAAQTFGDSQLRDATAAFSDSIGDLTKTIVNNGYSRDTEYEADAAALSLLERAGYPKQAMKTMLRALKSLPKGGEGGFTKTHPTPDQRLAEVSKKVPGDGGYTIPASQMRRYQDALGGL
jgi:predicted Zn-dependent protease